MVRTKPVETVWIAAISFFTFTGCKQGDSGTASPAGAQRTGSTQPRSKWQAWADSLSLERQRAILTKVLSVAEKEGWAGAVRYCSAVADTLTIYQGPKLLLQRVAERNRNPKNALADSLDRAAFEHYQRTRAQASVVWTDAQGHLRYYRPIYVLAPQCLKCHGHPEELDGPALAEIRKRYPGDKATGFALGDLRGLWKGFFSH